MTPLSRIATAAALVLLQACATAPAPGRLPTGPAVGDQDLSPFYRWDGPAPSRAGVLLREEPQPPQAEIRSAAEAVRILYASDDVRWRSGLVPVSGTLHLPQGAMPAGGWPLVAWAHGTLGVADRCAPSWAGHKPRDAAYVERWLQAGFAVVSTDYQGLGGPGPHPYLVWQAEARSVLDSVRAALAARPGRIANAVLVTGQSQGSGPAIGAALIAREYAPELRLLGAVGSGVVSHFPDGPYKPPVSTVPGAGAPHFTIMSLVGGGLRDDAPPPDQLVSAAAQPLLAEARTACSPDVSALARTLKVGMDRAFALPLDQLQALRLPVTDMQAVRVDVPLLLATGLADRLIPPQRQYNAVAALCGAGNAVSWHRYDGVGHNGSPHAAFGDALALARARLAGQAAPGNCAAVSPPGEPGALKAGLPFND
ncbi:MAG: lipase family protein [Rubrivivax sp.]